MTDEALVLNALGDPTRRQVFELLANGERHVAAITGELTVTQSAVSQHLRVLKDAGLIVDRAEGTRRLYRIDHNGLEALRTYVDRFWDDVLHSFTTFAEAAPVLGSASTSTVTAPAVTAKAISPNPTAAPVPKAPTKRRDPRRKPTRKPTKEHP